MTRPCHVVRVFTRGKDGGNHLGVVTDSVALADETMQRIATDLGYSETVFLDWRDGAAAPRVRIFTPGMELPFAGHPLVGTAWVMAEMGPGGPGKLRCGIGEVSYQMDDSMCWVAVPRIDEMADPSGSAEFLLRAELGEPARLWRVLLPLDYIVAEYLEVDDVAAASPDMPHLAEGFGALIWARSDATSVRARFFAPVAAVPEDPATGSAAVALAAALRSEGEASGELTIFQGEEIGQPSQIELRWGDASTSIGGTVVHDEVRLLDD